MQMSARIFHRKNKYLKQVRYRKLGQVLSRKLSLSCCVETVRRDEIKVTILLIPNNLRAYGHCPLAPWGSQSRA